MKTPVFDWSHIQHLMRLGLYDLVPSMCAPGLSDDQSRNESEFVRKYKLASGGPYCDCGYKKKTRSKK